MDGDGVGQEVMIAMLIYLYHYRIWLLRIDKCGKMLLNNRLLLREGSLADN